MTRILSPTRIPIPPLARSLSTWDVCCNDVLDRVRGERGLLVGRVPSDAVLPRAFHEVLFVGPEELCAELEAPLGTLARDLGAHVAREGAFERA